jgi:hypothetical protein
VGLNKNNNNNNSNIYNNYNNNISQNRPKSHYSNLSRNELYINMKNKSHIIDTEQNENNISLNKKNKSRILHDDDSYIESSKYVPHIIKNNTPVNNNSHNINKRKYLELFGMNKNFYIKNNMSIISKDLNKIVIKLNKKDTNKK